MEKKVILSLVCLLILFYSCENIIPEPDEKIFGIMLENTELNHSGYYNTQINIPGFGNGYYNIPVGMIVNVTIQAEQNDRLIGEQISLDFERTSSGSIIRPSNADLEINFIDGLSIKKTSFIITITQRFCVTANGRSGSTIGNTSTSIIPISELKQAPYKLFSLSSSINQGEHGLHCSGNFTLRLTPN